MQQDLSPADAGLSNCSIGAPALRAHRLRIRQNRIRGFASARYSFESPADAGLSNCSIGAPALRAHRLRIRQNRIRGFASARYSFESPADAGLSNCSIGAPALRAHRLRIRQNRIRGFQRGILMSEVKEGRIEVLISEEKVQERMNCCDCPNGIL